METQVSSNLQNILRDSLAHASAHSKSVYGRNPLTIEELLDLANAKGPISLAATIKSNGQPHLSPTDLVTLEGRFFLGVDKATARYKNLQKNPRVTVMILEGSKRQAIIEAQARFLEPGSLIGKRVSELVKKKYGWTTDTLAELIPEKVLTYKSSSG